MDAAVVNDCRTPPPRPNGANPAPPLERREAPTAADAAGVTSAVNGGDDLPRWIHVVVGGAVMALACVLALLSMGYRIQ